MAFLPTFPEISGNLGNLYIRQDLVEQSVTIYLKDWQSWDIDTQQIFIAPHLIHFVEPDGTVVGIKVLGGEN